MAQKTIMAIGGHIGDMELTTGGVLATLALKGWKVITVALTPGEKGNPAHLTVAQYREQKYKEAEAFARDLGGEAVVLPTPDGELEVNEANKYELCDIIRKYKPDVVLGHFQEATAWMKSCGARIPKTHAFVCLNSLRATADCAALDLRTEQLGARAAELVIGQLLHNEFGIPEQPSLTTLTAKLVEGDTLRPPAKVKPTRPRSL